MRLLPIAELTIPTTRQRREFDPERLMELQENIERLGLLQPIVIRNGGTLVAGERRLRALQELWELGGVVCFEGEVINPGFLPVVDLGDLGEIDAMDAELSENIIRQDLTWQEKAEALSNLQKLRLARNANFKIADLTEEVTGRRDGSYHEQTRKTLIVAKHLDNPKVAAAKDVKEAFKILKREEQLADFAERGVAAGKLHGRHSHSALHGDCLKWLDELPAESFDVICTDPPYGMEADSFGDGAGRLTAIDHEYADSEQSFRTLLIEVVPRLGRAAKASAALYLCCDIDQFHWLRDLFKSAGWNVFRTPLINVKSGSGRVPLPDHGPRRQYETILFAFRGDRKVNSIQSDVITTRGDEQMGHGAQKPVELFSNLLSRSCRPGDTVLDPFAGTGTIFPAAHGLKLAATGIEMSPVYYGMCVKRIEELKE